MNSPSTLISGNMQEAEWPRRISEFVPDALLVRFTRRREAPCPAMVLPRVLAPFRKNRAVNPRLWSKRGQYVAIDEGKEHTFEEGESVA